jgi:hypothetical protein
MMREPGELVAKLDSGASLPEGHEERFHGYTVMGLPFSSGHILALRRFAASSIGPAYTSIWHRDPDGSWTFYQDTVPEQGCSRYFGSVVKENIVQDISIEWTGPRGFVVQTGGEHSLIWSVTVKSTAATRLMNTLGGLMPRSWWHRTVVLSLMGTAARLFLGTGKIRLTGHTPNRQTFIANPHAIWLVENSHAVVDGQDLGKPGPLPVQGQMGDFLLPQRGIFAIGSAFMESFDAEQHLAVTSQLAMG